jgi:uncharacterized membrane protein YqjE
VSGISSGSVIDSLRRLLATLVALLATRAELVATELEEELHRAARLLLWAMASLLATSLAVLLGAATLVLAFRDTHPVLVAGLLAAVCALAALGGWLGVRRQLRERPPLLAATRGELARDEAALAGTAASGAPAGSPGEGL